MNVFHARRLTGATGKLLPLLFLCLFAFTLAAQGITTKRNYIRIDQFGYLPDAKKVAVIADPINGFNASYGINLNANANVQLRRASDNVVVRQGQPSAWNGGNTDSYSGDKGWWWDFSSYTTPGTYYIRVTENGGNTVNSNQFRIADDVYSVVLKKAMQMFYYQRSDFNKTAAYASGANWTDGPWYTGSNQDRNAIFLNNNSVRRDIRGGWIDAGDPNKYVTFATPAVHNLLTTYDQHPGMWDNFTLDIPESSNNVPDILDEIKFEIDWIRRMQTGDGGVYIKAGILNDGNYVSPPSTDTRSRYFDQKCANATITAAGMLAHAAKTFSDAGVFGGQISDLTTRAENAWTWYSNSNNKTQQCDGGEIEAGDADGSGGHYSSEHVAEAVVAAVYLYALTGKSVYNNYVKNNYTQCRPYTVGSSVAEWSIYRVNQGEALLYYSQLNNADNATKNAILNTKTSSAKSSGTYYSVQENQNLYRARAYFLNWGSNSLMSRNGSDNMDFLNYGLNTGSHANYRERAQAIVNYMHGVNPFGMVYLSNMYGDGAELCADEMWHTWFKHGTQYDNINGSNVGPAPGILSGGAQVGNYYLPVKIGTNEFSADVRNQPDQKRFSVKNDGANNGTQEAPWAYNEPAIYYQASYVKLLANFVAGNGNPPNPTFDDDIISVSNPGSFSPGEPFTVTVDYESSTTRDIYVKLEIDQSPWTAQADVERQTVNAGTGTLTFTITPYNNVPIANNAYKLQTVITEVGGGWGQRQDNLQKTGLDCVAGQSFDDAIVSTTVPGSFSPGQTVTITVNYEAASSGDVVVNLQNDSSPWTSRADEARATVSAGTGTLTFNMTVYNNCPIANDAYQFQTYLTSVGGGWGARRAQLNKNNRDCVAASGGTSDDWVYRENLTSGWSNWSWGGTTLQDGGVKKNGSYSLKFQSTGGALSPRHNSGKTGSSLNSVKFWARSWNTNYTCNVNVRQNDNNDGPNTGVAVTPTWQQFSLSPAQLGNPSTLKRFVFFVPNGRTLFVDDLRIVYNTSSQGTLSQELDRTALSREATDLTTTEMSVYPNPNPGQFTLDLRTPVAREAVSIRLYDLNGRLVDRTSISTFAGNNRLRMDYRDSDLATGVYLLRVVSPDGKLDLTQRLSIR